MSALVELTFPVGKQTDRLRMNELRVRQVGGDECREKGEQRRGMRSVRFGIERPGLASLGR